MRLPTGAVYTVGMTDPVTIAQGLSLLKSAFDASRSAFDMMKARPHGGTEKEEKAIDTALTVASTNTAIAEATLGQAFGYPMCKCDFPPTLMRTVGYCDVNLANGMKVGDPVSECPKCGMTNIGPFTYKRLAPPRGVPQAGK